MVSAHSPCTQHRDASRRVTWGTVHTSVTTTVLAPRDHLVALFLDYSQWPRLFPETIAGTELVRRDAYSLVVMVDHRREGRVVNVLTECLDGVVLLREFKRRYNATFVNCFALARAGTRYTIDAEVRLKRPYALVAPLLRGVVQRALRRYTMEPLRVAAERAHGEHR
jgi:hypothetical protein